VGIDANAAALRVLSAKAFRARLANLLYGRAAVEDLPAELGGIADRVTIVLPWGSLLGAVTRPEPPVLTRVRGVCRPDARLTIVLAVDAERDRAEVRRLGVPTLDEPYVRGPLQAGYATAGFGVLQVRTGGLEQLEGWPSTWARRLAHGRPRTVIRIDASAV
jgi:hypothetical protein